MPITKNCPICKTRMLRLYKRDHGGLSKSKFWGYLWICPQNHTVIIDYRTSESPKTYKLEELLSL